jgi:hypothetical protein
MTTVKATYRLVGWNTSQLQARIPAVLGKYRDSIDREFKEQIKLVQFGWPGITYRKNGTIEGSPRDIVDMGGFLGSQRKETISGIGRYELRFTWNVPYASLILTGYTTSNKRTGRTTTWPPRNWIEPALKAQPLDAFFAAQWRAMAKRKA